MFERLFKKQDLEIKFGQIKEYLDKEFTNQKNELDMKLRSYVQEINDIFLQIDNIINMLRKKTSENKYANTIKQKFCIKTQESIDLVKNFSGSNKEFIKIASEVMRTIGEFNLKDFRHLHLFRDDMTKIAEKLKLLELRINYANKAIASAQSQKIDKIIERVNNILENRSSINKIEQSSNQIKETTELLDNSISEMQQKMDAMNIEFTKYAEERIKLREIERAQQEIEQRIDNEFSGLSRVMKKFLYYGDLTKEESNILKDYIKDAGATFLSDIDNIISSILDKLYAYRDRKTIEMDESKHEKVKDLIRHIRILQELRQRYQQLEEEKKTTEFEFENRTAPIVKEIKSINMSISDKQRELGTMRSKIQGMITEKQMLEKETSNSINSLEFELSELLGKNVKVVQ